jgi:hypothetical protein
VLFFSSVGFVCGSLFLSQPFFSFFLYMHALSPSLPCNNFQVVVQFTGMTDQDHDNGLPEDPTWPELKLPDLLFTNAVREVHATIENEWDPLQRSACQTAAGRALWKHLIHDPLADLLAGETYLTSLYEKIKKDRINNAREVSGVILAVRTLWFDSKIEALLNSFTMKEAQVVFLGAGW